MNWITPVRPSERIILKAALLLPEAKRYLEQADKWQAEMWKANNEPYDHTHYKRTEQLTKLYLTFALAGSKDLVSLIWESALDSGEKPSRMVRYWVEVK